MKKFGTLLMACIVVWAGIWLQPGAAQAGVTDLLPENMQIVVKFGSFEAMQKNLAITATSVFGQPIPNIEQMKADLGFNPLNAAELKANGFDSGKEFGFAAADIIVPAKGAPNEVPNVNVLVFLPVTDGAKALKAITTATQKGSATTKITQEGALTVMAGPKPEERAYLSVKDAYLWIAFNPKTPAKPFLEAVLGKATSLTKAKAYANVAAKISAAKDLLAYVNLAKFMEKNLATIKDLSKESTMAKGGPDVSAWLDYLADYEGAGLAVDLGTPNLTVQSVTNFSAGAKSLKAWQGLQPNKNAVLGIPENPVVLLSAMLNAAEYYKLFKEALQGPEAQNFQTQLDSLKTSLGFDVEKDVLDNLAGNLNLGIYDGQSVTMGNFNTLLTVSVKDEKLLQGVIAKLLAQVPPAQQSTISKQTVGGVEANVMMAGPAQVYAGVKNKNLIVALGPVMFEKALKGDVAAGFVSKLTDQELAGKMKGGENLLYLSVDETMKTVKNFEMFFQAMTPQGKGIEPQVYAAAGKFEYALASSKLEGASLLSNLTVKTRFNEPFFAAVAKLAQSLAPAAPQQPPAKPQQSQSPQKPAKPQPKQK